MRKKIVAANWKMQGTKSSIRHLSLTIADIIAPCEIIVFPPFVFVPLVEDLLADTTVSLGAQNTAIEQIGSFTGEVSADMLKEFGCRYVLVGHSERRQLFGETNEIVAKKFACAQESKLIPMLCVGETKVEREAGKTIEIVLNQLNAVIEMFTVQAFQRAVIAYEPVWAIGTGLAAIPEQVQQVHAEIRQHIAEIDGKIASNLSILYGGSVKADNARALFAMPDVDGGLIGSASLNADVFKQICLATQD